MDRFEAHLERVEDAQAEDRRRAIEERQRTMEQHRRLEEAQLRADARLTRLEDITLRLLRAVRRERTDLRARIAALVEAQQRHETASAESQRRLEEAMAEMARAITKTNQRIDASSGNGHPEG
jgi:uncharacterized membrane protein YqiK